MNPNKDPDPNHPQEVPVRKNPDKVDPIKDDDLEPGKNNPVNPLADE